MDLAKYTDLLSGRRTFKELTRDEMIELITLLQESEKRQEESGHHNWFVPGTPYGIEVLPKHAAAIRALKDYREVLVLGGNRSGKTSLGAYVTSVLTTGQYPDWWDGPVFDHEVHVWAAGKTGQTTRDTCQKALMGEIGAFGSGMLPKNCIGKTTSLSGTPNALESVLVKHTSGAWSTIGFKSYKQEVHSFFGTAKHFCLAEDQLVQMADGRVIPIAEVRPGDSVFSADGTGKIVARKVVDVIDNGIQEVIRVKTKKGAWLDCTPDHEVYRSSQVTNKVRADAAEQICQARLGEYPEYSRTDMPKWMYAWAGLAVSEGCAHLKTVYNNDSLTMCRAIDLLPDSSLLKISPRVGSRADEYLLRDNNFWSFIPEGLAFEKRLPDFLWTSSDERIREFLGWLYFGDGWASGKTIGYASTSYRLIQEMAVLLSRLGIRSNIHERVSKKETWRNQYWLLISSSKNVQKFCSQIIIPGKESRQQKVLDEAIRRSHNRNMSRESTLISDRVANVKERQALGKRRVFDLSVEGEHRFFAGTCLVSNCWLDEPCPELIYNECLIRTMTTGGKVLHTITPKDGLTRLLADYLANCDLLAGTEALPNLEIARALMEQEEALRGNTT